jgi:hypothetical protein
MQYGLQSGTHNPDDGERSQPGWHGGNGRRSSTANTNHPFWQVGIVGSHAGSAIAATMPTTSKMSTTAPTIRARAGIASTAMVSSTTSAAVHMN